MNSLKISLFCYIIFITIINFFFLLKKNNNEVFLNIFMNQIRISDFFTLLFMNKKYLEVSNYLNRKYGESIKINKIILPKRRRGITKKTRKKIIIYMVDFYKLQYQILLNLLKDCCIIQLDSNKPDYLFYNIFGFRHLDPKYKNSIKIAIFTENKIPNLNEADYAIGQYHISYLDRYFRYRGLTWSKININRIFIARNNALNGPKRLKFCAALISN